jgi:uncharacterized protein YjiS (DUF1127 family)
MKMHTAKSLSEIHHIAGQPVRTGPGLLSQLRNAARFVAAEFVRNQNIREGIIELQKMDNWLLSDIGISRGDVYHITESSSWPRWCVRMLAALPQAGKR